MIKCLLFDFGDVFLNLDKPATLREFKKLGTTEPTPKMQEVFREYEKGNLSTINFLKRFREWFPNLPEEKIIKAWNAILQDLPANRLDFIQTLSQQGKYQLLLLSNTNALHIKYVAEHIPSFEAFKACFDGFYLSHEINFRKPDPSIFEYILNKHHFNPKEILFIDDTLEHIETAQNMGFHTWNIDPKKEDVTQLFTRKSHLF